MDNPPRLPHRFLRWFCHPDLLRGIEGDLFELFDRNVAQRGRIRARWMFTWDVVRLLRPKIMRPIGSVSARTSWGLAKHNSRMSIRVLKKDRVYTAINILGLALGLASFLAIYLFTSYERSFDRFHATGDRIYRLTADFSIDGMARRYLASSPPSIAPHMAELIPGIEAYARLSDYFTSGHGDLTLAAGTRKFREPSVCFAHPRFLELFNFPLIAGNRETCLDELRVMALTESAAKKYFGPSDPMGQTVFVDGSNLPYTVTGILADPPSNSSMQFDVLISYKTLDWWLEGEAENHWTNHEYWTYFLLKEGADPDSVEKKINRYYLEVRGEYNESRNFDMHFSLQPLHDVHFTTDLEWELAGSKQVDPVIVQVILSIGGLILVIAWINYLNLSTARALRRYGEIGIRKTLGARKSQLLGLFVSESFLIHCAALVAAGFILLGLSSYLEDLLGFRFGSQWLVTLSNGRILLAISSAALVIGVYPTLLLSRMKPNRGLGSSTALGGKKSWFFRGLVVFQFTISTALIIGSVVLYSQLELMRTSDTGFDPYHKLLVRGPNLIDTDSDSLVQSRHRRFIETMSQQAMVEGITTAYNVPGEPTTNPAAIQRQRGQQAEAQTIDILSVGPGYFKTLDIQFLTGRAFKEKSTDGEWSVVLNESAARLLGFRELDSALGQKLVLNYKYDLVVIGVIDDYNHLSSKYAIEPLLFYCDYDYVHYYIIDYAGHPSEILDKAEVAMAEIFPRDPFEAFFLDDRYREQYEYDEKLGEIILLFSGVAIVIACLGLIGLASHNTLRRVKEIGIRKTFGAGVPQILILLNQETFWLLLIANFITWPLMYQLMSRYLEDFATRISLGLEVFTLAGGMMAIVAILSISLITWKAARANPVHSLRDE
ncbi:MAG: ABC transporter permease [Bacteroidota bacterium]